MEMITELNLPCFYFPKVRLILSWKMRCRAAISQLYCRSGSPLFYLKWDPLNSCPSPSPRLVPQTRQQLPLPRPRLPCMLHSMILPLVSLPPQQKRATLTSIKITSPFFHVTNARVCWINSTAESRYSRGMSDPSPYYTVPLHQPRTALCNHKTTNRSTRGRGKKKTLTKHGGEYSPPFPKCGGSSVPLRTAFKNLDTTLLKNAGCPVRGWFRTAGRTCHTRRSPSGFVVGDWFSHSHVAVGRRRISASILARAVSVSSTPSRTCCP